MIARTLRRARRRRLNQVLTLCAAIALAAGLAIVWVRVIQTLKAPANPPRAIGQPGALVWDGRVFTTPTQLKAYLTSHGLSYSRWAARHPTAFGAPAPAPTRHTASTKKHAKPKPKSKPAPTRVAAPSVATSSGASRSVYAALLTVVLLIGGVAIAASAVVPRRYAPVAVQRFYAEPDRRMVAVAAATAILLGVGVSFLLS